MPTPQPPAYNAGSNTSTAMAGGWIKRIWIPEIYSGLQQYYRDDAHSFYVERNGSRGPWRVVFRPPSARFEPRNVITTDLPLKAAKVVYIMEVAKCQR